MCLSALPAKGVYTLLIFVPEETRLTVGRLGIKHFPSGYYTYTGSALGNGTASLKLRVERHLRTLKTKFWHIDYLLVHEGVIITSVFAAQADEKLECEMNHHLKSSLEAKVIIEGFGSSDCRQNCRSHLLFLGEKDAEPSVMKTYAEKFGSEHVVQLSLA